jgi:hypothetical protein
MYNSEPYSQGQGVIDNTGINHGGPNNLDFNDGYQQLVAKLIRSLLQGPFENRYSDRNHIGTGYTGSGRRYVSRCSSNGCPPGIRVLPYCSWTDKGAWQ